MDLKCQPNECQVDINDEIKFFKTKRSISNESLNSKAIATSGAVVFDETGSQTPFKPKITWFIAGHLAAMHVGTLVTFVTIPFAHNLTIVWFYLLVFMLIFGVNLGAHRLWSHRSFKANFGLRLFLAACHTMLLQLDLYNWCLDHRMHHKYLETDADPHNSKRGLFFSHIGWLLVERHPEVIRKSATVDMSDLEADPIVMFQRKYYWPLAGLFCAVLPAFIPVLLWNESVVTSYSICVLLRHTLTLHISLCGISITHKYGYKPYNEKLCAMETPFRHILGGEGFHNYHHAFPWDYSASELGPLDVFNPATAFINLFAYLGWAWDLKKAEPDLVEKTIQSFGNPTLRYPKGRFLYEWFWGLVVVTLPLTIVFLYKYIFLTIYGLFFTTPLNFELATLYNVFMHYWHKWFI